MSDEVQNPFDGVPPFEGLAAVRAVEPRCCEFGEACPCYDMKLPGDGQASLKKAGWDLYHYAALIDGVGLIEFRRAAYLGGGWWRLIDLEPDSGELLSKARRVGYGYSFDRGVDVHVSRIVWCADVG